MERVEKNLASQKGRLLSQDGIYELLKDSLQNIIFYYLSLFKIPSFLAERIRYIQKKFLWIGTKEK